jgi:hypothetical protein
VCDKLNLPGSISEVQVSISQLFWQPFAGIVEPDKSNEVMKKNKKLKLFVKKFGQPAA